MTATTILLPISFVLAFLTTAHANSVLITCSPSCGCMTDNAQSLRCTNIDGNALVIFNARKFQNSYFGLSSVTVGPFMGADSRTPEESFSNQNLIRCMPPKPMLRRRTDTSRSKHVVCTEVEGSPIEPRSSVSKQGNETTKRMRMTFSPVLDNETLKIGPQQLDIGEGPQIAASFGSRVFCLPRSIA